MGCLYIILPLQLRKIGILYIGVGLSALLVSTIRAMREPLDRGSSDSSAPRFSYMDVIFNCPARSLLVKRHFMLDNNRFTLLRDNIHIDKYVDINKPISRYTSKIALSPFLNIKTYSLLEDLLIDKFNLDKGKIEESRIPIKTKQ